MSDYYQFDEISTKESISGNGEQQIVANFIGMAMNFMAQGLTREQMIQGLLQLPYNLPIISQEVQARHPVANSDNDLVVDFQYVSSELNNKQTASQAPPQVAPYLPSKTNYQFKGSQSKQIPPTQAIQEQIKDQQPKQGYVQAPAQVPPLAQLQQQLVIERSVDMQQFDQIQINNPMQSSSMQPRHVHTSEESVKRILNYVNLEEEDDPDNVQNVPDQLHRLLDGLNNK